MKPGSAVEAGMSELGRQHDEAWTQGQDGAEEQDKEGSPKSSKGKGCGGTCKGICFGTWNIQNVGTSKFQKPAVMEVIRKVLGRYDVVGIQELSQKPSPPYVCGEYTEEVVCAMRPDPDEFVVSASPYLKDEQYAIMVRRSVGKVIDDATFPDRQQIHSRPPHAFNVELTKGRKARVAIALTHTTPARATKEIKNFPKVLAWMRQKFAKDAKDHTLLAGDFNAGGSYFKDHKVWANSVLDSSFEGYAMLTPNDMNSTVATSHNSYDRIIVDNALAKVSEETAAALYLETVDLSEVRREGCEQKYFKSKKGCAKSLDGVAWDEVPDEVKQDLAKLISDHHPVEVCLFG